MLSNGRISATKHLLLVFSEKKPLLPKKWINIYLDRFCQGETPSEIASMSKYLNNVNKPFNAQAPNIIVLANLDILIAENSVIEES